MFNRVDQRTGSRRKVQYGHFKRERVPTEELLKTSESSFISKAELQSKAEIEELERTITQKKEVERDIRLFNDKIEFEEEKIKRLGIVQKKLKRISHHSELVEVNAKILSKKSDVAAMKKTRQKKIAKLRKLKDLINSSK
eukprot:UN20792